MSEPMTYQKRCERVAKAMGATVCGTRDGAGFMYRMVGDLYTTTMPHAAMEAWEKVLDERDELREAVRVLGIGAKHLAARAAMCGYIASELGPTFEAMFDNPTAKAAIAAGGKA